MRTLVIASLILFATSVALSEDESPRGIVPADFYSEVTIEQTALSPNGDLLAFTVMTIDEEKNKRHRELWMQALKNGDADDEPFRFSNPTVNATSPSWSPDGKILNFQSKRGDDENGTWFIRVSAPGGEAYHIDGVEASPIWSPDGKWIAFTKEPEDEELVEDEEEETEEAANEDGETEEEEEEVEKAKKKEREGWIAPDTLTSTLNEKRFDGRVYTTMSMKRDGTQTFLPHRSSRNKRQLYVVAASGGEATRVTTLPYDVSGVEWTANSESLLFTGDEQQDDEYNDDFTGQIYAVSRDGGDVRALTTGFGSERSLAISPDGKRLAYIFTADRGEPSDLMIVDIAADGTIKSEAENLTADWDYGPGAPNWAGSNRALRWSSGHHGNSHLFESDLKGGVRQITNGDRTLRGISLASDARLMAYTVNDPQHPTELYVARNDGSKETRLTSFNDEWLDNTIRMPAERITWTVDDGTEVEGWVIKPVGYSPGVREYPMILKIHGGPHSAYGNYWFRTFHVLSNAGFFVFYPNPRGSSGYGHEFTYATRGQWGLMDSEDYLKGVDAVVAKYSDIDPDRVGVSGGSYGGYMSAWLSSTTGRFAAANPSRMICNWESWYGASDAQGLTEFEFDGQPWEVRELYRKLSPLSYVENVVAPTLIIHSENDYRTPIADGEQWYIALKKRGVPVEMVRYPRSSHGLSRSGEPWLLVDRLERIQSWFTHWLIDEKVTHKSVAEAYGGE